MNITEAAEHLQKGGLLVFPTETVYGLGALASNKEAIQSLFAVKGRPSQNPLILHIADISQLQELTLEVPDHAQKLMEHYWPGPLTLCFKKSAAVSEIVTAGLDTVCIRMPNHPIAQELLKKVDEAIAAPSANLSGRPSTTRFKDAVMQLKKKDISFLDGGDAIIGLESTVIDCSRDRLYLLRPGSLSTKEIFEETGLQVFNEDHQNITSPGQLLSHYAPKGKLTVLYGPRKWRRSWIENHPFKGSTVYGVVGASDDLQELPHQHLNKSESDLQEYSRNLYRFLNWCDKHHYENIILELPESDEPLIDTLLNRLEKSSKGNIIER